MRAPNDFLEEILRRKRQEVAERRGQVGDAELERRIAALEDRAPRAVIDAGAGGGAGGREDPAGARKPRGSVNEADERENDGHRGAELGARPELGASQRPPPLTDGRDRSLLGSSADGAHSGRDMSRLPQHIAPRMAGSASAGRAFGAALSLTGGSVRVIAEVKRRSPSAGAIAVVRDPAELARQYEAGGAAAISVLTDGQGFGGTLEDLRSVAAAVSVPVLRKDFLVDRYQLLEAKAAGADAVLLIVAALEQRTLVGLLGEASALQLDVLTEVHDGAELDRALEAGARVVGINNRNLRTFVVDLGVAEALLPRMPAGVVAVAESGVRSVVDAQRLRVAGAANFLIGEALVRSPDPAALLRELGALR